jgi:hypothetical protein
LLAIKFVVEGEVGSGERASDEEEDDDYDLLGCWCTSFFNLVPFKIDNIKKNIYFALMRV